MNQPAYTRNQIDNIVSYTANRPRSRALPRNWRENLADSTNEVSRFLDSRDPNYDTEFQQQLSIPSTVDAITKSSRIKRGGCTTLGLPKRINLRVGGS